MDKKYYVYILCDPRFSGEEWGLGFKPFYVGKGSERRATRHLEESKKHVDNIRKHYKIEKIRAGGLEPIIVYHSTDLLEQTAYDTEKYLIKKYGRKDFDDENGILTNFLLDGRPPVRSGPMSQEQKDAIGAGNRGKKRTPEQSAYLSSIRKGKTKKPWSDEVKEKIRLGNNPNAITITEGMKFGSWTVLKFSYKNEKQKGASGKYWSVQCSCAKQTIKDVCERSLTRGTSKSCCHQRKTNEN